MQGGDAMTKSDTPRASDDRETAEHKSRSIDERVPDHRHGDAPAAAGLRGAFGANIPQAGLGNFGPLEDDLGPGEEVLDLERKAQRAHPQRG
jgi:hypothetical protein